MSIEIWKFVVCIIASILVGGFAGYRIGKRSIMPRPAGIIDFEPGDNGKERCVFKLQGDVDWIAKQNTIIFEVRHTNVYTDYGPMRRVDGDEEDDIES